MVAAYTASTCMHANTWCKKGGGGEGGGGGSKKRGDSMSLGRHIKVPIIKRYGDNEARHTPPLAPANSCSIDGEGESRT